MVRGSSKFHVFFNSYTITNWEEMKSLKESIWRYLPQFDSKALDSARFYFGTASAKVEIHEGKRILNPSLMFG